MKTNIKDIVTNICSFLLVLSGTTILIEKAGVPVPLALQHASIIAGIISGATIGYFTGKGPDGSSLPPAAPTAQK